MTQGATKFENPNRAKTLAEKAMSTIAGMCSTLEDATQRLQWAAQNCHVIGGASVCPMVEGHEIQITVIPINIAECYPIRGKDGDPPRKGIPGNTIFTIANAAEVEWTSIVRTDDRSDPYYAAFRVCGRYKTLAGTYRLIEDERDVDLRDGSDQLRGKSENGIAELRANMLRSCETKAQLRALRKAFGVSQGMFVSELEKPFVFAKAVFTGRSNDQETRRMFAQVIAHERLIASHAMYGGAMPVFSPMQTRALPQAAPQQQAPKMIPDAARFFDDDGVIDCPVEPSKPEPVPDERKAEPAAPPPARAPRQQQQPAQQSSGAAPSGAVWPWEAKKDGDTPKGTPLEEVDDDALDRLIKYCEGPKGNSGRFAASNAALADAARSVLRRRSAGGGEEPPPKDPLGDEQLPF